MLSVRHHSLVTGLSKEVAAAREPGAFILPPSQSQPVQPLWQHLLLHHGGRALPADLVMDLIPSTDSCRGRRLFCTFRSPFFFSALLVLEVYIV